MNESSIKSGIRQYLKTIPVSKFFPYNPYYGESGIPDIIGLIQGKFVAFEVKVPGNKPTELQELRIKELHDAGGLVYVVHSLEETKEIISHLIII